MAVNLSPVGGVAAQFFDNSGNVLTGGKLYTYAAGTTTSASTYTSSNGATAWSNPIVLDAAGRVSGSGEIWLTDSVAYKFVLKDSNDVLIATYDSITGINSNFVNFVSAEESQTATAGQTLFTLTTIQYQPGTDNLLVFVNGSKQISGTNYTETSSSSVTFLSGLNVGDVVDFNTATPINTLTANAATTAYTPPFANSVTTNVEDKLAQTVSVMDFGAVGDGITDDTSAFTSARTASNGKYYIPEGTYLVDASPDVWADCFTAAGNCHIKIGSTTYNVSNAFAGRLRFSVASNVLTYIQDSVTGNNVIGIQNGAAGTATYFDRTIAVDTDSHFLQVAPATNNGETDLLFTRSLANADPHGNRFNITFEESTDRLITSYATTASGSPAFDTAFSITAGTSPALTFPALSLDMKQGYTIQTRAGGALKIQNYPTSATTQAIRDVTSGNVLQINDRSKQKLAGISFDTLYDTPLGVTGPRQWGGVFGDTGADATLPITKNLWDKTGATHGNQIIGTLMVSCATSGGTLGYRESRFVYDGTTVTITDIVNTLPVQVTATVAVSGNNLQFQASYSGGLGGGCTVTPMIQWCGAGR